MRILLDKAPPAQANPTPTSKSETDLDTPSSFLDFFEANSLDETVILPDANGQDAQAADVSASEVPVDDVPVEDVAIDAMMLSMLMLQQPKPTVTDEKPATLVGNEGGQVGRFDTTESVSVDFKRLEVDGRDINRLMTPQDELAMTSNKINSQSPMPNVNQAEVNRGKDELLSKQQVSLQSQVAPQPSVATMPEAKVGEQQVLKQANLPRDTPSKRVNKAIENAMGSSDVAMSLPNDAGQSRADLRMAEMNLIQKNDAKPDVKSVDRPVAASIVEGSSTNQQVKIDKIELLQANGAVGSSHRVHIKVTPVELGPVIANLKIDKNRAELEIVTKNAHVSEAIKVHLPDLRAQFSQSNIELTTIDVREDNHFFANNQGDNQKDAPFAESSAQGGLAEETQIKQEDKKKSIDSLVDAYI